MRKRTEVESAPAPKVWRKGQLVVLGSDDKHTVGEVLGREWHWMVQFDGRPRPTAHEAENLREATEEEAAVYHALRLEGRIAAITGRLSELTAEQIGKIEAVIGG